MDPVFDWHPLEYALLGSALICIALAVVHAAHPLTRDRSRYRGVAYLALAIALLAATALLRQQEPDAWWTWPVLLALPALLAAAGLWVSDARVLMSSEGAGRHRSVPDHEQSPRLSLTGRSQPSERFGPFSRLSCICCRYAMVDYEDPSETCRLCDWEARGDNDELSLEEARRNFERWRSIYPPDRLPPWMTHGLSEEEQAARESILACFSRMQEASDLHDLEQWYEIARIEESFERRAPRPQEDTLDSASRFAAEETSREQRYYGP